MQFPSRRADDRASRNAFRPFARQRRSGQAELTQGTHGVAAAPPRVRAAGKAVALYPRRCTSLKGTAGEAAVREDVIAALPRCTAFTARLRRDRGRRGGVSGQILSHDHERKGREPMDHYIPKRRIPVTLWSDHLSGVAGTVFLDLDPSGSRHQTILERLDQS